VAERQSDTRLAGLRVRTWLRTVAVYRGWHGLSLRTSMPEVHFSHRRHRHDEHGREPLADATRHA